MFALLFEMAKHKFMSITTCCVTKSSSDCTTGIQNSKNLLQYLDLCKCKLYGNFTTVLVKQKWSLKSSFSYEMLLSAILMLGNRNANRGEEVVTGKSERYGILKTL